MARALKSSHVVALKRFAQYTRLLSISAFVATEEDDDFDADVPVRHERGERSGFQPSAQDDAPVNESGIGGGMSRERRNKVVNIQTTAQLQVVLVKPSAFTDAKQIAVTVTPL